MSFVLGLDAGGTKTLAALAEPSGRVVQVLHGGGLDPNEVPDWEDRLTALLSGLGPVAAALGLPVHGEIPAISARQTALGEGLFGSSCLVVNDVAVAFEGALGGADGVLILAGTGSMAWARGPHGQVRVGGWGHAFGDEGSAFWLGREALALVSQHLDGRRSEALFSESLLKRLEIRKDELNSWVYQPDGFRARVASVARKVAVLADTDVTAQGLVGAAADHLARHIGAASQQSGSSDWTYAGGLFQSARLVDEVAKRVGSKPKTPVLPPLGGAILLAARQAGWHTDTNFITTLAQSLAEQAARR
jgi:glucosamine kinase